jgi:hypothetical protein
MKASNFIRRLYRESIDSREYQMHTAATKNNNPSSIQILNLNQDNKVNAPSTTTSTTIHAGMHYNILYNININTMLEIDHEDHQDQAYNLNMFCMDVMIVFNITENAYIDIFELQVSICTYICI